MKVALTGATGFIGRHVLRCLVADGLHPTLVVRPGRALNGPLFSGLPAVEIDFDELPDDVYNAVGRPDVLIHLAWGGLPNYRSDDHLQVELPCHVRLLEAMVAGGLPRMVVSGTCFEYGMQSGELHEEMPAKPDNPYGKAKDTLRVKLESLQQNYGFQLAWARLFYMFGEDQSERSLYPMLRRAALAGDALFPMSGGEQVRDFLPIAQVAARLVQLAKNSRDVGVVNLCSGRPVTVLEIVERWISDEGWRIRPQTGIFPYPDYEPMEFWGSLTKWNNQVEHNR